MLNFTSVILENFFRAKATRLYPAKKRKPFPKARGKVQNQIQDCILCSKCARSCPSQAIKVDKKTGLWELDPMCCVYCGVCVSVCPTGCLNQANIHYQPVPEKFLHQEKGQAGKKK